MADKENAIKVLSQLIPCYENDILRDTTNDNYEQNESDVRQMIIELTRWIHDIRYCSRQKCKCSPEHSIKEILERNAKIFNNPYYLYPMQSKVLYEIVESAGLFVKEGVSFDK